jgi:hypothetical protein
MLSPALIVAAIFALTAPPSGRTSHARLASVDSRVAPKTLETTDPRPALRADLERELGAIDWKAEGVSSPFVLSAVLTEAESSTSKGAARASCKVELVLREPTGKLLGKVGGFADGEDRAGSRAALELGVIDAAAKSASSAIPEAIRQSRKQR